MTTDNETLDPVPTRGRRAQRAADRPAFSSGKEVSTDDFQVGQQPDIDLSAERNGEYIEPIQGDSLHNGYAEALSFGEEPVTILIQQANMQVDNPPSHVPVSVQGKGAEVLMNGRFVPVGWLPIGQSFTTKRKYLEVLLRSKQASVQTNVQKVAGGEPINRLRRDNGVKYPVSIIRDANPKGMQWMMQVLAEA